MNITQYYYIILLHTDLSLSSPSHPHQTELCPQKISHEVHFPLNLYLVFGYLQMCRYCFSYLGGKTETHRLVFNTKHGTDFL